MPNQEVDMGRITVMLPVETIEQIGAWAANAGLKRGQFASMALVIGSRHLARQLSPEDFLTPELVKNIVHAAGGSDEQVSEALKSGLVTVNRG